MLISYAGSTITTDTIGNTLWDGLFSYTWQNGRQLASATRSGMSVSYQYNADGIRTSKTVNGILHTYDLSGTSIVRECIYNSTGTYVATELRYYYDAKGAPAAMHVFKKANANATPQEFVCYFATNLQGDVVALYDEDGNRIASYTYDAWGNNIHKNGTATPDISATNAQWLMNINPFRYRGYYYDTDTGLYYLQSRYYNPNWGRFINADVYINANGDLIGFNLYAYCSNNPIMNIDPSGHAWYNIAYDWINTLTGLTDSTSSGIAVYALIVAAASGRWDDIKYDWNNGCLNPFNQSEDVALKSRVLSFYKGSKVVRQDLVGTCSIFGTIWANSDATSTTLKHEYGHSIQENLLGNLYYSSVAIPSVLYCGYDMLTNGSSFDYYSMPWERTADWLGGVTIDERSCGYKNGSLAWGIIENVLGPCVIPFYIFFGY